MRNFLFVFLILVYGCENKNNLTYSIQYVHKEDVINELKSNQQVLQLNYYESTDKEKSNNQINYMLDIDYQSKVEGNLDTSSHIELISMSENLTVYPRGKNTFLLSISTSNLIDKDSILYDIYQCSGVKKYVDTYYEKKDTVDKILLFQQKEFLGGKKLNNHE